MNHGASEVAARFVQAVVWGEHTVVWELLSEAGRQVALSVALANGLDRVVAARIKDDVADPAERDDFLRQLVHGLRRDLRSVDIDHIEVGRTKTDTPGGAAVVDLTTPSVITGTSDWPAGRLMLSVDDRGGWRVDRLEPIIAGP